MANRVGHKGQVVIEKDIRERLGVEPGWLALQQVVGDRVELRFVPPEHKKSLKGSLAEYTKVHVAPGKDWEKARQYAWTKVARQRKAVGRTR